VNLADALAAIRISSVLSSRARSSDSEDSHQQCHREMKVKDTMRAGAPGNPQFTKFVQNKVLGEAACWALSLQWIATTAEGWGTQYLEKVQTDDGFKQLVRNDQGKLISKAGQDPEPFAKNHQQSKRLNRVGLRKAGGEVLKRHAQYVKGNEDFYERMARAFAGRERTPNEYFVIANVRFQQKGGLGHSMAGHFRAPAFTYFDPNGGVLRFPFAGDFITWFRNRFKLASEAYYDIVAIAEFDYYIH
jgi:hypothetical protein